ncbi:cupin domain-containing protein [Wenxinia saemankumensis]|uniref:Uncharacterized conserved protein, cupin superfamily n=1 Tax=Wenxinia saemankumensis TaxID=1447782 RepID=A0A1M6CUN5_9RHOB|nr:cupin domain-containing protein [Wenxinia saemankumensis]SHI64593.1 Uncharacterized conserved protein, cupin superfamily [Wenxinia saemankumensis]
MPIHRRDSVPLTEGTSSYPAPFDQGDGHLAWRALGDAGGLTQFGVALETIRPGGVSSQMHWESAEDEFLYMLEGEITVIEDGVETVIGPGDCCTWPAGGPPAHTLRNHTGSPATYLIMGSRRDGNVTVYPGLDLLHLPRGYARRDGTPYPQDT